MDVKITIEYTDVFDQEFKGISETKNLDNDDDDLDIIIDHFKRSCLACGFHHSTIDRIILTEEVTK